MSDEASFEYSHVKQKRLYIGHGAHTASQVTRVWGRRRQGRRVLHGLLKFDPMKVPARGVPGFGAGSGAPSVMFGFLKHLWYTGDKSQALLRCAAPPCARGTSAAAAGARAQPPRYASRATPGASRTAVSGGIFLERGPLNSHALPRSSLPHRIGHSVLCLSLSANLQLHGRMCWEGGVLACRRSRHLCGD